MQNSAPPIGDDFASPPHQTIDGPWMQAMPLLAAYNRHRIQIVGPSVRRKRKEAMPFSPIPEILEELKAGKPIVLVDDEDRENEGDIVFPAEKVTPEAINFMAGQARGL